MVGSPTLKCSMYFLSELFGGVYVCVESPNIRWAGVYAPLKL